MREIAFEVDWLRINIAVKRIWYTQQFRICLSQSRKRSRLPFGAFLAGVSSLNQFNRCEGSQFVETERRQDVFDRCSNHLL
jgi:hypothetical protein